MKGKKKFLIIGSILIVLLVALSLFLYFYFTDESKLNVTEKRFLADNSTTVQNINILNNVNIFGNNGTGVFYDFLEDFYKEYNLKMNPVIYNTGETPTSIAFTVGNTISDDEFAFYEGHYVLIGKKEENFSDASHLSNQKIGILSENLSYVSSYLDNQNLTIKTYNNEEELNTAFKEQTDIEYMIVPLYDIENILKNNYTIAYHFSDIPFYYKVNMKQNETLGSILKKYYMKWEENKFQESYKNHLFKLFTESLGISLTEIDAMQSISYNYGFVSNSPYEILSGGNYGGIIAQYLKEFIDFSNTEIKFTKYKNVTKLGNAIQNNNVDLYFGFYNIPNNNFNSISSNIPINFSVIADKEDDLVVKSLKSLSNITVYVEENSSLYVYLKMNSKIDLKTYKTEKELKKLLKKEEYIIVDNNVYYANRFGLFNDYSVRFSDKVDNEYHFKVNTNETFTKLFAKYINFKDPAKTEYKGIYNYELTFRTGTITGTIAKYFMYILIIFILVFLYVYKLTKKIKLSKKIKKEDKLKYIDQLTSLKNRNYLSENLENWSQNTVYPQSVVVIDLNNLQYINDTMGYEKGDEQIKAAANILVKSQLDNSDIIRTDGNEFVIYLVGYSQKQIANYIHKLNKDFKRLPYEQGAAIGYSMIVDDIKSVEDAINEAVEEVKKQKESKKEENA